MLTNKEKLTAQALKYVEKGQYDKAIREYMKIVAEDEKDVRTWLKIGDLFVRLGQKSQAAQTYQRVARFYADQGFYLKAVAVYKQILKLDPRLVDMHLTLAELYRQLGLIQDAINQYEAAAATLQREGRTREAIAAHQAALELDPTNVAQRIKLAELYSREGLPREAAREFRRTAEQLRALGRLDDFLKVGERLLFHDPDDMEMARELADVYLERQDPRRALTKLQLLFRANPRDPNTLELLGRAFLELGQRQKCVSVLKELGRVLLEGPDRERALAAYRRVLQLDPHDPEAREVLSASQPGMEGLAGAEAGPGQVPAAARQPCHLVSGPPGSGEAGPGQLSAPLDSSVSDERMARLLMEADVYAKYGLYQKAIEHVQRVLQHQPQNRSARERLCSFLEATDQPEAAVAELWSLFGQATTLEEAARCLSEILRIDPGNKDALHRWQELRRGHARPSDTVQEPLRRSGEAPPASLQEELDQVDFFLRHGLHQEARHLLDALLARYPGSAVLLAKAEALREAEGMPSPVAEVVGVPPAEEIHVSGPTFEMTRQGIREKGSVGSAAAACYERGMAYRDMGLYADAIAEFRKAAQDRRREAQSRTMIGLCLLDQERHEEAVSELKRALLVSSLSDQQRTEIYYYLGRSYEQMALCEESISCYEMALKYDGGFRDARERVARLRTRTPAAAAVKA
ncbi:MAG: tetratricopeptide repeat protein [Myxococcales bacterium]|nr:tetratricopeptide repeat protein [Myxococcales bacterium]